MRHKKNVETVLVLVLLLVFSFNLDAQFVSRDSKKIDLKRLIEHDRTVVGISGISVISNLPDSSLLGIVPSTSPNERTDIVVASGSIQSWLQAFVTQQFSSTYNPSGKKIKWVINSLSAGTDSSSDGIFSFTKLNAEIYSLTGSSEYKFTAKFDTLMISKNGDVDFGSTISNVISALYAFTVSEISIPHSRLQMGVQNYVHNVNSSYRILTDQFYPTGIYTSFQQFLDNAPAIPGFMVRVNKTTGNAEVIKLSTKDSSQNIVNSLWGIAVSNELYKYENGQLYPIEKVGRGFMLSKYIDPEIRKNKGLFWRHNVGGRIGDYNPFDDKHIYRSPTRDASLMIEATHLDMKTGNLTF